MTRNFTSKLRQCRRFSLPARPHRTILRLNPLEDRAVPATVLAGFNDAAGIHSNPTINSPYPLGGNLNGTGTTEPGWAGPWSSGYGSLSKVQSGFVYEGDGAMHLGGGTVQVTRDVSNGTTAGVINVSQMIYIPAGGGVGQYLQDSGPVDPGVSTASQWMAIASQVNFQVTDGGFVEDTGIPIPIQQWIRVDIQVDMTAKTWHLFINGTKFNAPDPLSFRGTPNIVNRVNYLVTNGPGVYIDELQLTSDSVARDDRYTTPEDVTLNLAAPGVLANDLTVPGVSQAVLVAPPIHAAHFNLNADGSFDYTPAAHFHGTDSFTYRIVDGAQSTTTATVVLTIDSVPDQPIAANDAYELPINSPAVLATAEGVLANDVDPDGNVLQAVLLTSPALGTLDLRDDGSFDFAFPADFHGTVSFTYKVNDGTEDSDPATVTLTRPEFVNVTAGLLTVRGTSRTDVVRLRPAAAGGILVELFTRQGDIRQVVRPQPGIPKFTLIDVYLSAGDDRLDAPISIPMRVVGGPGSDVIRTGPKSDTIFGDDEAGTGTGADRIDAGGGVNTVIGGHGRNVIRTGSGPDVVLVGDGDNSVSTGGGPDRVTAGNGRNDILTGTGNDTVTTGTGGSFIDAGFGNDAVTVAGGANWVLGGGGKDVLVGGIGDDVLDGGAGKDLIVGGLGADLLNGAAGGDLLFDRTVTLVSPGTDSLAAILSAYQPNPAALANIAARLTVSFDIGNSDTLMGGTGIDWFWTNDGLDVLDLTGTEPRNNPG